MAKIELDIKQAYCTENPCYKLDQPLAVRGLMLHSVGCPQPDAMVFIRQFNRPDFKRACVHAFIDANTGDIYQTLPWEMRGWHAGGTANGSHIGVEMCEPPNIRYRGAGCAFDCADPKAAAEYVSRAYRSTVRLFAWLCRRCARANRGYKVYAPNGEIIM
ncbi:MAG: N-acetylmuramoyl-L-alanine amidase [Clostridiales bacterium]|nr:N-acetylmuramoyl-L-alanine amidase [Clostridiales bacterium]